VFLGIEVAPPDPILGITLAFNADTHPNKVNLGVGAYRTDEGKPYVLNVVRKVEKQIANSDQNKEYLPIDGLPEFKSAAQKLLFHPESPALKEGRVASTQSISGTGALRIGAEFIQKFFKGAAVLISDPTWGNHPTIFNERGVQVKSYRYFDPKTNGLDFDGMIADLEAAPKGSVVILHVCAHNPTGVDPTREQWHQIAKICKANNLFPFFDCAYQGYASGDLDNDAYSMRYFVSQGFQIFAAQSFAKNFGLYGERIGAFHAVCSSEQEAKAVLSQLKLIVRPMYSNPPLHGARLVSGVLNDKVLYDEWVQELKGMSHRILSMRQSLSDTLKEKKTPGDWSHILKQIGMFTYTGLTTNQVEQLITRFHIHMLKNGRISMAGLNSSNVKYVAQSIHSVVTEIHP